MKKERDKNVYDRILYVQFGCEQDASANNHYLSPLTSSPPSITQCKRLPRGRARECIVWIGLPYHLPIELPNVLVLDVGVSGDRDSDCANHSAINPAQHQVHLPLQVG